MSPDAISATWYAYSKEGSFVPEHSLSILPLNPSIMVTFGFDLSVGQIPLGNMLGGTYEVEDVHGGWLRYKKSCSDGEFWLEYCASRKQWQLKPSSMKDSNCACKYIMFLREK